MNIRDHLNYECFTESLLNIRITNLKYEYFKRPNKTNKNELKVPLESRCVGVNTKTNFVTLTSNFIHISTIDIKSLTKIRKFNRITIVKVSEYTRVA